MQLHSLHDVLVENGKLDAHIANTVVNEGAAKNLNIKNNLDKLESGLVCTLSRCKIIYSYYTRCALIRDRQPTA